MRWVSSLLQARQGAGNTACICCVTECVLSNVRLCSSLGRFALSCSIVLRLWGGSFVRKGLSGSQVLLWRICGGESGPFRERPVRDV